jgi:vacuolar-type H+-ATPase subunit B/Vma2
MIKDQFDRERLYQATLNLARAMLRQGLITEDELAVIDSKMREKYRPLLGSLWP